MKRLSWRLGVGYFVLLSSVLSTQVQRGQTQSAQDTSPAAIAKLIKDLTARDQKVKQGAAGALEKLGVRAIEELLIAFEKGDDQTRHEVALILGGIRRAAIVNKEDEIADPIEEILLKALRSPNYHVVSGAAQALTLKESRSKKAIPEFIAILRSNNTTHAARAAAMSGLQEFGADATAGIPVLLDNLKKKRAEKMPKIANGQDLAHAINSSKDSIPGERATICKLLGTIGPKDEAVAAALTQILKDRMEDIEVKAGAALGLAQMDSLGQGALPDIIKLFKETDKDKNVRGVGRNAILRAISQMKLTKKEIMLLIEVATDRDDITGAPQLAVNTLANNAAIAGGAWMPLLNMLDERGEKGKGLSIYCYLDIVLALGKIDPPPGEPKDTLAAQLKAIFDRDSITSENQLPELTMAAEKLLKKLKGR